MYVISRLNCRGNLDLEVLIEDLGKIGGGFTEHWAWLSKYIVLPT